ncbi:ABC transporter substrate-binding protein [Brachybacterium endophyticum]|uniref:ABC transporter substrate-binding protein n=1 Tax=Brachybacterium endophyticum TaxID=2182385 RepID=A0A2U2RM47_9MICO|nr:iron-siderophore ABC transporter substrate-binding protein [Brachybacterium endophyticum]PWH06854.1 ABC transporter substrate-binding protein [Brachybacterium endophyticum]
MLTRRSLVAGGLVLGSAGLLAACGNSQGSGSSSKGSGSSDSGGGAFPVTLKTAFGDVEVKERPQRVVALGWGDAETALALGVQPVGASDWIGFGGEGVGPWAKGMYDSAPTIIETLEPDFEAIASLTPDLILDVKSSGDSKRHDRLSQIATTVGIPEKAQNYLTSPKDQLRIIGKALGASDKADQLQKQLDDAFAKVAEDHGDWKDKSVTVATKTSEGWGAYVDGDTRLGFLEGLGFTPSKEIAARKPGESGFSVSISAEQLDSLDADLLVAFPIYIKTTEITGDKQWKQIPAVADGHAVVVDGDLSSAFSLGTVLAQKYALTVLPGKIEKALGA